MKDAFTFDRIDGDTLRSYTVHWPPDRWQEYEPLLGYCRDNQVRLVACGAPLEVFSFIPVFLAIKLELAFVSLSVVQLSGLGV